MQSGSHFFRQFRGHTTIATAKRPPGETAIRKKWPIIAVWTRRLCVSARLPLSIALRLGTDPEFADGVLEQIGSAGQTELEELRERERIAIAEVRPCEADIHRLATNAVAGPEQATRLASAQERQRAATERLYSIVDEIRNCDRVPPDEEVVRQALRDLDPVWNALAPREQQRVLNLLVQRVDYNGESGNVEITFEPDGFEVFLEQFSERQAVA